MFAGGAIGLATELPAVGNMVRPQVWKHVENKRDKLDGLGPLTIIAMAVAGLFFGRDAVQAQVAETMKGQRNVRELAAFASYGQSIAPERIEPKGLPSATASLAEARAASSFAKPVEVTKFGWRDTGRSGKYAAAAYGAAVELQKTKTRPATGSPQAALGLLCT